MIERLPRMIGRGSGDFHSGSLTAYKSRTLVEELTRLTDSKVATQYVVRNIHMNFMNYDELVFFGTMNFMNYDELDFWGTMNFINYDELDFLGTMNFMNYDELIDFLGTMNFMNYEL